MEEFIFAVTNMKTAPELDFVSYEWINALFRTAKRFCLALFNRMFRTSYYPEQWHRIRIMFTPKPGKKGFL